MPSQARIPAGDSLILGIDGGGTKTAACLCQPDSHSVAQPLGRGIGGGSNVVASGLPAATNCLNQAIQAAFADAGLSPTTVRHATLGLAGCGDPTNAQLIQTWCQNHQIAGTVSVFSDIEAILRTATPNGWGVAVAAGTGSSVLGFDADGRVARAGGYGYVLGDEGSGFWIGREAIRGALQAMEGSGPETSITPHLTQHLGVSQRVAIAAHIHRSQNVRQAVAECAMVVTAAAEEDDPVATEILERAGRQLAKQVLQVATRLELEDRRYDLVMVGSVLVKIPAVAEAVRFELSAQHLRPEKTVLVDDPALTLARGTPDEGWRVAGSG